MPVGARSAQTDAHITVTPGLTGEFSLVIGRDVHNRFGVAYPLTFQFDIPSSLVSIGIDRRYDRAAAWSALPGKTATDGFNGIEAFRVDQVRSRVFVSVPFSASSDTLFLRFTSGGGPLAGVVYRGMPTYYDGRKAAVTVSADDWADWFASMYPPLLNLFRSYGLYVTGGGITSGVGASTWGDIQRQLDSGYVEIAAHSRTHPSMPYPDPVGEVIGCIDDIRSHVTMPSTFRKGDSSYVYVWIAPNGAFNKGVDTLLRKRNVLVARLYGTGDTGYSAWEPQRDQFAPMNPTLEIGAPSWGGGETRLTVLNAAFDSVVARGGVYHFMWHPQTLFPDLAKAYLTGHLQYVSRHPDLWYANLGHIYLYRLMQLANAEGVASTPEAAERPATIALMQNYPNPFNPATTISWALPAAADVRVSVYDVLGREVAVLAAERQSAGVHAAAFDGTHLASGMYVYRLTADDQSLSRRLMLLK